MLAAVVETASASDSALQELGLLILGMWAEEPSHHHELVYAHALRPLVLALRTSSEPPPAPPPKAHLHGARALSCLTMDVSYRKRIIEADAVPLALSNAPRLDYALITP